MLRRCLHCVEGTRLGVVALRIVTKVGLGSKPPCVEIPMSTEAIAKRLVELCREGKYEEAQKELYSEDAVSIEPEGLPPGMLGNAKGLKAIFEKTHQFQAGIEEVHGGNVSDPVVAGNWFSCEMTLDVTMKERGRVVMTEICVYHVKDGKVDREQFFYDLG
jgi:hypothetical protein